MLRVKLFFFSGLLLLPTVFTFGQSHDTLKLAADDPVVAMIDSLLKQEHIKNCYYSCDKEELNVNEFPEDLIPETPDSVYIARLEKLNSRTPFEFQMNADVMKYLKLYAEHRRTFTEICLARSQYFFPLFEEKLDKYNMPMEIKYLSVVESALNPTAKSWAGAMGLWQFMLRTGKMYGLEVDSYIDERRDPIKATEAACSYLSVLHKMYGDWSMALAAYNAGPGNVNRAIRRSGGETTYWKIRKYLPKETQGYVPAFIAINYIMAYASDHNIYPRHPKRMYYDVDTVAIQKSFYMEDLALILNEPVDLLQELNPIYKTTFIPKLEDEKQYLYLPVEKIGDFIVNEDTLYNWRNQLNPEEGFIAYEAHETYRVRRGESLGLIAQKYDCTIDDIKAWNNLNNNMIHPGQELTIITTKQKPIEKKNKKSEPKDQSNSTKNHSSNHSHNKIKSKGYKYYTIQKGDTLWDISNREGVSLERIRNLNQGLNERNLKAGTKIRISEDG